MTALEVDVVETPAMQAGTQRVFQHSWCGTVIVVPDRRSPGACPCCDHPTDGWWEQSLPVAGLEVARPHRKLKRRSRRRGPMETPEYAAMMRRMIRRYGERVAAADPVDLGEMVEMQAALAEAVRVAVRGQHDAGFSWAEIAQGLGTSRQAAFMRFREPDGESAASQPA